MNPELKRQLLEMVEEDQRVRTELAATGELFQGYALKMAEVHRRHAHTLEAMIEQYGRLGRSLVGDHGANAAWLILQHAIGYPELQRRCLPILREAVERGEAEPEHAAYLEDRIRFFERRPQRYGTHFDWDENGQMSPYLLEDPERVDEYRQAVGLSPLAERIEEARDNTEGEPKPSDLKRRENEMRGDGRNQWAGCSFRQPLTTYRENTRRKIMRSFIQAVAVLVVLSCPLAFGQTSGSKAESSLVLEQGVAPHAGLDEIYRRFTDGYKKLDAAAVVNLYSETAAYLAPEDYIQIGRQKVSGIFTGFFDSVKRRNGRLEISFRILQRQIDTNLAYDVGIYTLTSFNDKGDSSKDSGKFVVVARRENGNVWRFQVDGYSGLPK